MNRKPRIVAPSPAKKQPADWGRLWAGMRSAYELAGMDRQKAMLDNFKDQKEEICRVLNVVSDADLARMQRRIAEQTKRMKGM